MWFHNLKVLFGCSAVCWLAVYLDCVLSTRSWSGFFVCVQISVYLVCENSFLVYLCT